MSANTKHPEDVVTWQTYAACVLIGLILFAVLFA